MDLLKLVIVDDESILLQGLLETYDWNDMGFEVVGSAMSGEQAIQVIEDKRPDVVLSDIRMKKISGLQVIEEIHKKGIDCMFIMLTAYKDFEYAREACNLGAYAYLLKPIDDDMLKETMTGAYEQRMKQIRENQKYERMENLLSEESDNYLQVMIQKYVDDEISEKRVTEIMESFGLLPGEKDRFVTVCTDIDLVYKITGDFDPRKSREILMSEIDNALLDHFQYWKFEDEDGSIIFIVFSDNHEAYKELEKIMDTVKDNVKWPLMYAVSRPFRSINGIKKSYEEAKQDFSVACTKNNRFFSIPGISDDNPMKNEMSDAIMSVVNIVRKNNKEDLKEAFISFIYKLPKDENRQSDYIHRLMICAYDMMIESYGLTEELQDKFTKYYRNMANLSPSRAVDVCYKILSDAINIRSDMAAQGDNRCFEEYLSEALAYIEENLDDETLSIVSVASHVYLNPVYFGRVFKSKLNMTFKQYLLKQRMEKAKRLLETGTVNVSSICEQVGINNPSYFTHLFKQYAGKLPSEYKKEYET